MIKAVIFDMDGLMFDTESTYSIVLGKMSIKRGKEFTLEVKKPLMGKRAKEAMVILNEFWGLKENTSDLLAEQDKELVELYKNSVTKLEGLVELLSFLDDHNIRKCIATSSRGFLVDILLEKHGLKESFEFVVSGDMVKKGKPDPEIYNLAISRLSLTPSECLVLEDSLNGVKAGVSAGCHVCAIPSEYTKDEDFSSATMIRGSLNDKAIQNFIQGL